ncbi:hypothetical protein [Macrococcus bovicus]|uniref:hypothetical protein n=1 Tax=Macrococcus bovicus TaxID=69968 RepID=UPI0025A5F3A8|nr:hypothetical protein [Macrococcus bovicus]WJP97261.1 hypothetical protein QSV55_08210 [Macrococcus bovicus]
MKINNDSIVNTYLEIISEQMGVELALKFYEEYSLMEQASSEKHNDGTKNKSSSKSSIKKHSDESTNKKLLKPNIDEYFINFIELNFIKPQIYLTEATEIMNSINFKNNNEINDKLIISIEGFEEIEEENRYDFGKIKKDLDEFRRFLKNE